MVQMMLGSLELTPLPPSLTVGYAGQNEKKQLLNGEEVVLAHPPGLFTVQFKSFFPREKADAVLKIKAMFAEQKPVRFLLTGSLLSFNDQVLIDSFTCEEAGGAIDEIGYQLRLVEYRSPQIQQTNDYRSDPEFPYVVRSEQKKEIVHTVVWGDTLWALSKRYLGDATRYPEIAAYNNIPNPNLIYVGQVIRIP